MFWTVTGFAQSSPIESILDKGSYTLEELLDEDDLIQECKSLNARLIHYLRQPSTVEKLLRYIVEPADDNDNPKRAFKYPYSACEVFCCEVDNIFCTLVEEEHLMALLFSLLDAERPLNCMLAGYFSRVVNSLLLRKTSETMKYLEARHEELLPKLLRHIDTTSITEIMVRLVGADEQTRVFLHAASLQWLLDTPTLQLLLDLLGPDNPPDVQKAAADVLASIAETQLSPLARDLAKVEVMDALFERAFAVDGAALVPALNVCIALLEPRASARENVSPTAGEFLTPQLELKMKTEAVFGLAGKVSRLVAFLDGLPPSSSSEVPGQAQDTPFGGVAPPLGSARLKVVELLAALARSGMKPAEQALLDSGAVARCMQLFAAYPFNNLLHKQVAGLLATLLEAGSDATVAWLLGRNGKLASWLAHLPTECGPVGADAAADAPGEACPTRCTKAWRAGYTGHVTQLGNLLLGLAAKQPAVADALASSDGAEGWGAFVDGYLRPQNARESADSWACGRPHAMDMAGLDSEPDEFDADLDLEPLSGQQPQQQRGRAGPSSVGVPDYRYGSFQGPTVTQDDEGPGGEGDAAAPDGDSDDDDGFAARFCADQSAAATASAASSSSVDEDDVVLTAEPDVAPCSGGPATSLACSSADAQEPASAAGSQAQGDASAVDGAVSSQEFGFGKFWRQDVKVSADTL